jgi:hypothetical protein
MSAIDPKRIEHICDEPTPDPRQIVGSDDVVVAESRARSIDEQAAIAIEVLEERSPRRAGIRTAMDEDDRLTGPDLLDADLRAGTCKAHPSLRRLDAERTPELPFDRAVLLLVHWGLLPSKPPIFDIENYIQ